MSSLHLWKLVRLFNFEGFEPRPTDLKIGSKQLLVWNL